MVKLFLGEAGSGKTKKMLEMANTEAETTTGEIVFIEPTPKHLHQLHRDIRFISTEEFQISCTHSVYGLLCGLISANYDINTIYLDSLDKIIPTIDESVVDFIELVDALSEKREFTIIIAFNVDDSTHIEDKLKKYLPSI